MKVIQNFLAITLVLFFSAIAVASPLNDNFQSILPAAKAFKLKVYAYTPKTVYVQWTVAPGYHLFKDAIKINTAKTSHAHIGTVVLPNDAVMLNTVIGRKAIYENELTVTVPIKTKSDGNLILAIHSQGCAGMRFCFPPETRYFEVNLNKAPLYATAIAQPKSIAHTMKAVMHSANEGHSILDKYSLPVTLLIFLGIGLLLAFTPCVLPMVPIIASLVMGQKQNLSYRRGFVLSLTYVIGVSVTYAIAGVIAARTGQALQAALQTPWALGVMALIFVLLALSLFNVYEIRLPGSLQQKLTELSNRQRSGSLVGVFIMGVLSALVISPCVSAPLVGVLTYITTTGNQLVGGLALFALGLGMGLPLIAVGTFGAAIMPKVGRWLLVTRNFFGYVLLAMAVWVISRVIPGHVTLLLWGVLALILAVHLGVLKTAVTDKSLLQRVLGLLVLVYGVVLLVGGFSGGVSLTMPLAHFMAKPAVISKYKSHDANSVTVVNLKQLKLALSEAKQARKPVMLDYYADWCLACKEMDENVFAKPRVQNLLKAKEIKIIKVDLTANNSQTHLLQKRYGVFAPPTVIFLNKSGQVIESARIFGAVDQSVFLQHLSAVK